jgi:pyruvate dehydrogenase E2 component (dihydrolipoamide acetyltransferase)
MPISVLMPQMGESIAEGTLVRWLKKVGDSVDRDEPLFEISTDKVDAEIPSPAEGVLTAINVEEGGTAPVNSVVAVLALAGDDAAAAASSATPDAAVAPAPPEPSVAASLRPQVSRSGSGLTPDESRRQKSSPLVRKIAREHGVDLTQIAGSGLGGRITKANIQRFIERTPVDARSASTQVQTGDRVEKLSVMRRKIAEHMVFSRRTAAHVHTVFHVNFSTVAGVRAAKKADYERAGVKLTYVAFIARAVVDAIGRYPVINASLDGDDIIYKADVNLGIAVALDNGLIVPVVKGAGTMGMADLARSIADVAARARAKKLMPDEVSGGTFTITNPGQSGAQFGLPIINQPQVAILCVGAVEKRPIVVDDTIGIRLMSYLTLGFDHRLIDGAVADAFMADVKRQIENFDLANV